MASSDEGDEFMIQGTFEPFDAERLLPRLEREGIRFEIEILHPGPTSLVKATPVPSIALYVHRDDLEKWSRLCLAMYPL